MATGTIIPVPKQTAFSNAGAIISGAKLYSYVAGTSTPVTLYSDVNLSVALANPVIADSAGRFSEIFGTPGTSIKLVLKDASDVQLWSVDNIQIVPAAANNIDITGTAGEAISAGQAVYLSDGSGGKTAGSWYKGDATATYSSLLNPVGIAPSAIASGASGTIRLSGYVTGLSGLTVGAVYYISGTAGSLTSTAPTNARIIGSADTTSSLVLEPAQTVKTQSANVVYAGPSSGSAAAPTFRALVAADLAQLDKSLTEQEVANTTTETAVYSFSVPANTLVANKALRLTVTGSVLNNTGGAVNLTIAVKLGATTIARTSADSVGTAATRGAFYLESIINANNATNSQRASTKYIRGGSAAEGSWVVSTDSRYEAQHGSLAVDMTSAQTLQVTVTWASASVNASFKRFAAILELLG